MSRALCVRNGKRHSSHLKGLMRDAAVRVGAKAAWKGRCEDICAMEWSRDGGKESGKEGKNEGEWWRHGEAGRGTMGGMRWRSGVDRIAGGTVGGD